MVTYTTSTLRIRLPTTLTLEDVNIYCTLEQGDVEITKDHLEVVDHVITIEYSQRETAMMHEGKATVMLNFYFSDGRRLPSTKSEIEIKRNVYERVITE